MLAGMGAQGTGGKAGTQWAVGFKQGNCKDGDSLPWTRSHLFKEGFFSLMHKHVPYVLL